MVKCDCYHTETKRRYTYNPITGDPIGHDVDIGVCWGTKECEECSCGGNETKCDFYPEVRKKARKKQKPKFGEWISVEDRLPEKDVDVLCYSDKNGGYFFVGYRGARSGEWCKDGVMHVAKVLYWAPISEPPKGE